MDFDQQTKTENLYEELDFLNERIREHCEGIGQYDEALLNLGVQLGRLLERGSLSAHRPKVFIDTEERNMEFKRRWAPVRALEKSLINIFHLAVAEEINAQGSFCFSEDDEFSFYTTRLSDSAVEKFQLQILQSTYAEYESEITVEVELKGELGLLMGFHKLPARVRFMITDIDEERQEKVLTLPSGVKSIYGVLLSLNPDHTSLTTVQIEQLQQDIEKIEFSCLLKSKLVN